MTFYKVRWFKCSFCKTVYSLCFRNVSGFANILSHIPLENKMEKVRVQHVQFKWFYLKLKNIILFLIGSLFFIFFKWRYSQCWRTERCFKVDLMLCNVATSYQHKSNVETTLKCLLLLFYLYFYNPFNWCNKLLRVRINV